jgi:predicted aspartyl protease
MSYAFVKGGAVVVRVRLEGPANFGLERFAVDTGAQQTCIPPALAREVGLQPEAVGYIWTASGSVPVSSTVVPRFDALGVTRRDFRVLVHELPEGLQLKGLLGLDFFRDTRLTIDFRAGVVSVS